MRQLPTLVESQITVDSNASCLWIGWIRSFEIQVDEGIEAVFDPHALRCFLLRRGEWFQNKDCEDKNAEFFSVCADWHAACTLSHRVSQVWFIPETSGGFNRIFHKELQSC